MGLGRNIIVKLFVLVVVLLYSLHSHSQKAFNQHKSVVILPAFYYDNVDTVRLDEQSQRLKLIGTFKKEIGIDVQYKFYLPLMLNPNKFSVFFRGVDTVNRMIEGKGISLSQDYDSIFHKIDTLFNADAIVVLELKEINTIYKGAYTTIISSLLASRNRIADQLFIAQTIAEELKSQTVGLTLTAKIYDCSSGLYLWQTSASISNKYYHDAVKQLVEIIHKRLPYKKRKG